MQKLIASLRLMPVTYTTPEPDQRPPDDVVNYLARHPPSTTGKPGGSLILRLVSALSNDSTIRQKTL